MNDHPASTFRKPKLPAALTMMLALAACTTAEFSVTNDNEGVHSVAKKGADGASDVIAYDIKAQAQADAAMPDQLNHSGVEGSSPAATATGSGG